MLPSKLALNAITISSILLLSIASANAGTVYKCKDTRGKMIFTDNPASCVINPVAAPTTPAKATIPVVAAPPVVVAPPTVAATPPAANAAASTAFGSYLRPFAVNSPWNSRPLTYTLGSDSIPTDAYEAVIGPGDFSTSFFVATASDGPVTIYGVFDQDSEVTTNLVLPHWPAGVSAAAGSDGHIDVLDSTTGIIHSFWVARLNSGKWTAKLYAWSKINSSGFGDPAHYYQGARAAAVPTSAGIIRKHEIDDGKDQYQHALAMSLTYSALSPASPGYIYPATSADYDYMANKGKIPEGALMMLPPTFDLTKIQSPAIRKVAKTLMTYGAYVVDRNTGTPFVIYQEIGTKGIAYWQQSADTRLIRAALRQATATQFADGNGKAYTPDLKQNTLSMRGNFGLQWGKTKSTYETYNQKRIWGKTTVKSTEFFYVSRPMVIWATPKSGDTYTVTSKTDGGARFRFQVGGYDSGMMDNGASKTFKWPASGTMIIQIESGIGDSSSASGLVVKQ